MDKLIKMMLTAFANNFTLYLKAHNFHWTVTGCEFKQDHEFLGEIYGSAQEAIDDYAEQLRRIGAFPQGDFKDIVKNSLLNDPTDTVTDSKIMFLELLADFEVLVAHLQDTYDEAGKQREYGLQNFLADRIDGARKFQWQLTATVTDEPDYKMPGQQPEPYQEYCHFMKNPDTGLMVEVEDPEEHDAAIAAGYTEEVPK